MAHEGRISSKHPHYARAGQSTVRLQKPVRAPKERLVSDAFVWAVLSVGTLASGKYTPTELRHPSTQASTRRQVEGTGLWRKKSKSHLNSALSSPLSLLVHEIHPVFRHFGPVRPFKRPTSTAQSMPTRSGTSVGPNPTWDTNPGTEFIFQFVFPSAFGPCPDARRFNVPLTTHAADFDRAHRSQHILGGMLAMCTVHPARHQHRSKLSHHFSAKFEN